jgi:hypothetical protein
MNFKRKRAKNQRAGCLRCKPHKMNGAKGEMRKTKIRGVKGKVTLREEGIPGDYQE